MHLKKEVARVINGRDSIPSLFVYQMKTLTSDKINKGKRTLSSTASETSTNTSLLDTSVFEINEPTKSINQSKNTLKKLKPDQKKQKTMTTFITSSQNETQEPAELSIEKRLDEISQKLSNVLTKDDSLFIKEIIRETVEQLKDKLLGNVIHRIEILESDCFEQTREIELLKKESSIKSKLIEDLKSQNAILEHKKSDELISHDEFANNTEQ
ncbi:hypothetical protein DPMN_009802 [Dreissena polymorpha]|uniref:Uncharacterized protein n=1 Tax=Dreissena polymorpha TaxID=45954 RepID=A0A9D4N1X0_DREPO|nr:hypothetical protein DPMN_009802 [Dreissena polymorpha]